MQLARPKHWIKNLFVLAPVPFAIATEAQFVGQVFVLGLVGFSLINSAVYTLNDLLDAPADRLHPHKCRRPLATGAVSPGAAVVQAAALFLIGLGLCMATGIESAAWLALIYVIINLGYSLGAKDQPLLDVFLLSSGFVIRVLLGCALVAAPPSAWLLLCSSSLALFLGFAKRRADLLANLNPSCRPSLQGYSRAFLDQAMSICAGVAMLSYVLYCIESPHLVQPRAFASTPFVAYGILNYLRLTHLEDFGGSPVEVAYTSPSFQLCALGWAVAVTWSLGLW